MKIGSAYPLPEERTMAMRGRNLITGLPEEIEISSIEIREAISRSTNIIVDLVRDSLDETPPELVSDLMEVGICLAGGGGLLKGLAERISEETHIRTWVAQDAMTCVARGAGKILENFEVLKATLSTGDERLRPGGSATW